MSYCVECGRKLDPTDVFCSNCGLKVGYVPIVANQSSVFDEKNAEDTDDDLEIITLFDEDIGKPVKFHFLDLLEYKGKDYVVLTPAEIYGSENDETELAILEVQNDALGNETYVCPDNTDLLEEIYEEFKKRNIGIYNFIE